MARPLKQAPGPTDDQGRPVDAQGHRICGDPSAKSGRCGSRAIFANGKCERHGGKVKQGAEHPRFKDGRQSIYFRSMPERWRKRIEARGEELAKADLLGVAEVTDQLIHDQVERLQLQPEVAAIGELLLSAAELVVEVREALEEGERGRLHGALGALETKLMEGATAERQRRQAVEAEGELRKTVDLRRKVALTEAMIVDRTRAYATMEEIAAMQYRFADTVVRLVERTVETLEKAGVRRELADLAFAQHLQDVLAPMLREMDPTGEGGAALIPPPAGRRRKGEALM